jgi:protein-tyrosine-phosphatase
MTDSHRAMVRLMADPEPRNLILFREFTKGGEREIADPYGCPLSVYEASRDEMVEAIPSLVQFIKSQVK